MAQRKRTPKKVRDTFRNVVVAGKVRDEGDDRPTQDEIRRVMSALGKIGGPKGGRARADKLSEKTRIAIARKAALARWRKQDDC